MKINKGDSPVAVIVLVCILVTVVGRTIWLVVHGGDNNQQPTASSLRVSQPGRTPTAATAQMPAASAAVPSTSAVQVADAVTSVVSEAPEELPVVLLVRNPFANYTLAASAESDREMKIRDDHSDLQSAPGIDRIKPLAMPWLTHDAADSGQTAGLPGLSPGNSGAVVISQPSATRPPDSPANNLRVTAIVGGTRPTAVMEAGTAEPGIVHVGDTINGMRVTTIDSHGVTLKNGRKIVSLSMSWSNDAGQRAAGVRQDN
jgi:hypothetical protein